MSHIVYVRAANIYNDSRATKEILALAEYGHNVTVLSWNRDGKDLEKCPSIFQTYSNSVQFYFFNKPLPNGLGMKNIDKLIAWIFWIKTTLTRLPQIDAIHACNLDGGLGVYRFCKKNKIKLIYDIFDYYVDSHTLPSLIKPLVEKLEIKAINLSEITIICTEERKQQIVKADPREVIVIHNSPAVDYVSDIPISCDYVYCGSFGEKRLLKEILDIYPLNCDLCFEFAGYGEFSKNAKLLSERYPKFHFGGSISYDEVLQLQASSLCISAIYEPSIRNHQLCAPNKFYEALALRKPVIVCRGTGIDSIVEKNNIGIVIDYSAEEFYKAVRFLKANPCIVQQQGLNARKLYEEEYSWSLMKKRLIDAYMRLLL